MGFTEEQLLEEHLISWFLKDLGGPPLDFRGYVSGAEASEDEDEAGAPLQGGNDLVQQMGQGYYSGYLLKKSSRDPCLWRRRWCVLGEDKLWYMKLKHRRTQGRAAAISLGANHALEHPRNSVRLYKLGVCRGWMNRPCHHRVLLLILIPTPTNRRCSTASRYTRRTASSSFGPRTARSRWRGSGPSRRASSWRRRTI